jgi:site-specific recombinase XerD
VVARTQRVDLPDGSRSWTVLGEDHLPVGPVEEFLEHHRLIGSSPNTVRSYARALALYFSYLWAVDVAWPDPGLATLTGFLGWLRTGGAPGVGSLVPGNGAGSAAPATVAARLSAVVAFYRYAESAGYRVNVPHASTAWSRQRRFQPFLVHTADRSTPRAGVLRVARDRGGPPPILTPAQVEAVLDGCASFDAESSTWVGSLRDRLLFALLAESGLRLGEALGLRNCDWHTGGGRTPFVEVVPGEHPHRVRVKGSQYRQVFVSGELDRLYGEYLWQVADAAADRGCEVADDWYVFCNLSREPYFSPLRPEGVYAMVGRLRRRLRGQIPAGWSPHWLRHTHATALLLSGVPLHVVTRRLGHAHVQTTMDLYGWVTEEAAARPVAEWRRFAAGWQLGGDVSHTLEMAAR